MKFIKTLLLAIITFLAINSFSGDTFARPRVKVYAGSQGVKMITTVQTRHCHKWIRGHCRRNRYGHLIWVPGHWRRV